MLVRRAIDAFSFVWWTQRDKVYTRRLPSPCFVIDTVAIGLELAVARNVITFRCHGDAICA